MKIKRLLTQFVVGSIILGTCYIWLSPSDGTLRLKTPAVVLQRFDSVVFRLTRKATNSSTDTSFSKWAAGSSVKVATTQTSHVAKPATPITTEARRYLIYNCRGSCGGWADRLKGIVVAYVFATLTNRTFGIRFDDMPCPLTDFVRPNEVDWDIPRNVDLRSGSRMYSYTDSRQFYHSVPSANFDEIFTTRVVLFVTNLDYFDQLKKNDRYRQQLEWLQPLTNDQAFARIFRKLFKLSPKVRASLDSTLQRSVKPRSEGGKLVCAHLRFASNSEMLKDSVKRHTKEHGEAALSFLQSLDPSNPRYNATQAKEAFALASPTSSPSSSSPTKTTTNASLMRFFVTADSDQYIEKAEKAFPKRFVWTTGRFVHVDKAPGGNRQAVCDGMVKVIEDQQLLSACDVLVISKSGFSRQAAYLRGTDAGLYCVLLSGHLVKCQRSHLRELYQILG